MKIQPPASWRYNEVCSCRYCNEERARLSVPAPLWWDDSELRYKESDPQGTFDAKARKVYDEGRKLLVKKHHDYGPHNIAGSPGGPLNGLRVRMYDKLARINNLLDKDVEPANESLRDSFIDLMNYGAIALMVIDGAWPNE